jgi:hypothetical protein
MAYSAIAFGGSCRTVNPVSRIFGILLCAAGSPYYNQTSEMGVRLYMHIPLRVEFIALASTDEVHEGHRSEHRDERCEAKI